MRLTPAITATESQREGGKGRTKGEDPLNILSALTHYSKCMPPILFFSGSIYKSHAMLLLSRVCNMNVNRPIRAACCEPYSVCSAKHNMGLRQQQRAVEAISGERHAGNRRSSLL